MSREEQVLTKRALFVVAVLSVLGSQVITGIVVGWCMRSQQEEIVAQATAAATAAAVASTQVLVRPLEISQAKHEGEDDAWHARTAEDLKNVRSSVEAANQRIDAFVGARPNSASYSSQQK